MEAIKDEPSLLHWLSDMIRTNDCSEDNDTDGERNTINNNSDNRCLYSTLIMLMLMGNFQLMVSPMRRAMPLGISSPLRQKRFTRRSNYSTFSSKYFTWRRWCYRAFKWRRSRWRSDKGLTISASSRSLYLRNRLSCWISCWTSSHLAARLHSVCWNLC